MSAPLTATNLARYSHNTVITQNTTAAHTSDLYCKSTDGFWRRSARSAAGLDTYRDPTVIARYNDAEVLDLIGDISVVYNPEDNSFYNSTVNSVLTPDFLRHINIHSIIADGDTLLVKMPHPDHPHNREEALWVFFGVNGSFSTDDLFTMRRKYRILHDGV